jgi:hypothetical protein
MIVNVRAAGVVAGGGKGAVGAPVGVLAGCVARGGGGEHATASTATMPTDRMAGLYAISSITARNHVRTSGARRFVHGE